MISIEGNNGRTDRKKLWLFELVWVLDLILLDNGIFGYVNGIPSILLLLYYLYHVLRMSCIPWKPKIRPDNRQISEPHDGNMIPFGI